MRIHEITVEQQHVWYAADIQYPFCATPPGKGCGQAVGME
jgi:hypothetical protein